MIPSYLISIKLVEIDTENEWILYQREKNDRIQFMKTFKYGNYEIQLRLDWGDIVNDEPMLDADIRDLKSGKMLAKKRPWHHTEKKINSIENRTTYLFEFNDLSIELGTAKTMGKTFTADAVLVDSLEIKLKKGNSQTD